MPPRARIALVTGCSSGIGRQIALALAREGFTVYASARRVESIEDLAARGCRLLALDVTDAFSRSAAVAEVERAEGAIDVLVNNAGITEVGATESVDVDRVRALFETNVFGAVEMAKAVLPAMRERREGMIVTMGSMNGRWAMPAFGAYAATKHALEAFSDALRYETRPFGIRVSLIAPGLVDTGFADAAVDRRDAEADGPYAQFERATVESARTWRDGARARLACTPEDVARTVVKAATARRPRARYRVAPSATLMLSLRRVLPESAFDAVLRMQFPSPRAPGR